MIQPRWRKVMADLWSNKTRSALTVLTIMVGLFAVGFVSGMKDIMLVDMNADHDAANPHSGVLYVSSFDDGLVRNLHKVPGVAEVEGRAAVRVRIGLPGVERKIPLNFQGFESTAQRRIDQLRPSDPPQIPALAKGEVLFEVATLSTLPLQPGDLITVEMADGKQRQLRVAGLVRDVTQIPYHMGWGALTGYTSPETIEWLGGRREYTDLYFNVSENKKDEAHVNEVAAALREQIERSGRQVYGSNVYKPGQHYAAFITEGVAAIMAILGGLSVFLSIFLIVNTINALLAQHTRQIGVMKAIGGGTVQIAAMYLALMAGFGLLALAIAIPLSGALSYFVIEQMSGWLNFQPAGFRIAPGTAILQAVLALGVPVLSALFPVLLSTRITVREAISAYGLGKGQFGQGRFDRLIEKVSFLPRPVLISLRNTIRRKARLAMTLITLTLGGAIFIAVLNLRTATANALNEIEGYYLADVNINLDRSYRIERLAEISGSIPGVTGIEAWMYASGELSNPDGSEQEVGFLAPPSNSQLIDPVVTAGRWLVPEDDNAVVVGNHLLALRPDLCVGDTLAIEIEGRETTWKIVGFYRMAGNTYPPLLYTNKAYLSKLLSETGRAYSLRVITADHSPAGQKQVATALETSLKLAGIDVSNVQTGAEWRQTQASLFDVLIYFMLAMALAIAAVGGLGLMSTMSINVLERTREIGVLRAIGASNGDVQRIVVAEGLLIGLGSWFFSLALSLPITQALNAGVGSAILSSPLDFAFGWQGSTFWLASVIAIAALASAIPAWNASRLTIREVLAYE
ncbi:MAG: ABC transporter permease [Chloroflexota bacterium]